MAFKIKNLMIHVLPDMNEKLQLVDNKADQPSGCTDIFRISLLGRGPGTGCLSLTGGRTLFTWLDNSLSDPIALATLRGQLQEALARVQEQEQAVDEKMRLKTVEEAQALEEELVAALDEVRQQKAQLQKQADGGQG